MKTEMRCMLFDEALLHYFSIFEILYHEYKCNITRPSVKSAAQVKISKSFRHTIVNIFLPISLTICFGCSKEPSH